MRQLHAFAAAALYLYAQAGFAAENDFKIKNLSGAQTQFKIFSEDIAAALSYKAVIPAEPLGITGFDIGVELSSTKFSNPRAWAPAVQDGNALETLIIPKLHAHKGLPWDVDVGLMYTSVPDSNVKLIGGEVRYSLSAGDVLLPALAVRGTFTKLSGVDDLAFTTKGLELAVSKGITFITPYAGVGYVWVTSDPSAATLLAKEEFRQTKYYVGANFNFALINLSVEGDKTGDNTSYSAKVGLRF